MAASAFSRAFQASRLGLSGTTTQCRRHRLARDDLRSDDARDRLSDAREKMQDAVDRGSDWASKLSDTARDKAATLRKG